jgi:molybdenum transport protein
MTEMENDMIRFTDQEIDRLIEDDVPLGDLTSALLGLHRETGQLTIAAREKLVICGTEEAARICEKAGLVVEHCIPSGTLCQPGDAVLEAVGNAASIHMAWRASGIFVEFASGIATRTRQLVDAARKGNPDTTVAGSRKHSPFAKKMALKALYAGGGVPHRTSLSDTVLIFQEHLTFLGGYEQLPAIVQTIRKQQKERMIVVEAHSTLEALTAARSGANFVQLDKMPADAFADCAAECRRVNTRVGMIAAGGIHGGTAEAYASAGADVLVSSWMYAAPPADVGVHILRTG